MYARQSTITTLHCNINRVMPFCVTGLNFTQLSKHFSQQFLLRLKHDNCNIFPIFQLLNCKEYILSLGK